jgi:ribosome biogenesis GTPase / thiamine phosphate phosphatase
MSIENIKGLEGIVIKSTGSWYTVMDHTGVVHLCRLRGKFKMSGSKSTNPIAVGDKVSFSIDKEHNAAIIEDIHPRKNYIIRKATNLSRQTHVIAANLDQAVIIATMAVPRTSTGFIDRFLVTCEAYSIPAIIVFNKIDLYPDEVIHSLDQLIEEYKAAGYRSIKVSATTKENLQEIKQLLKNKTTLLAGHSGVGKSTLINAIDPRLNLKVQNVSLVHLKGKHTTTFAEMFPLQDGGYIIDTPGIKEFGLVDFDPEELCHFFPEMRTLFNKCRFDNCTHLNEPGCKVKEEVENGNISISRYSNYINMLLGHDTRE